MFHQRQGCSLLVITALPLPAFSEESLMSAEIYVNSLPKDNFQASQLKIIGYIVTYCSTVNISPEDLIFRTEESFKSFT